MKNIYVITGGPGSGKTTLLESLREIGYNCIEEFSMDLIRRRESGDKTVPLRDTTEFSSFVLDKRIEAYKKCDDEIYFEDSGIPDTIAYFRFYNGVAPEKCFEAAKKYPYKKAFFLPPWREIFQLEKRKESFEDSVKIGKIMKGLYEGYGCEVVEVPRKDPIERVGHVLRNL